MKIIQTSIAIIIVLGIGLLACSSFSDDKESTQAEGSVQLKNDTKQLPDFVMSDASGKTVNLSSFKGKKVFVNLWATWCPPCRAEIPSIESLAGSVDKEHAVFIMLSLDENFETAKNFARKNNLKVPVFYPAEKLPVLFNTDGIPATFIFNENGDLIKQNNGAEDYSTTLYTELLTIK